MTIAVLKNDISHECYVLEIDGQIKSEHRIYAEALKEGLKLKMQFPHSDIKVHEPNEQSPSGN